MTSTSDGTWLILIPQLPPQPSSLRVRVWRRLQQLGAVALKNAAYALPDSEATLEDFQWLAQEITDAGGGVMLLRANGLGEADEEIRELFRAERARDYRKLAEDATYLATQWREEKDLSPDLILGGGRLLQQLRERHAQIRQFDFFEAVACDEARTALDAAAGAFKQRTGEDSATSVAPRFVGRSPSVWVTRQGVYVDRLACAWLIRRFVNPEAEIVTVRPDEPLPKGAVPFDMKGVEFGHHGSQCSAETMAAHFRPEDPALRAVTEVVHDLDLKDDGFGRPEAAGLKRLLDGIGVAADDDQARIRLALPVFEALYLGFRDATAL